MNALNEDNTKAKQFMLSTKDNPFDPFTQFDEWDQYDFQMGHHSCEVLATFAHCSDDLSMQENNEEIAEAIERIIKKKLDPKE